jgi:hypothetical protein
VTEARREEATGALRKRRPIAGGSGEPPHRSPEIVTLLRSHALAARTARTVARIGEAIRQEMGSADIELASLIDDSTGEQVGDILSGEPNQIHLPSQILALRPGRRYAHVHTHPGSGSFSDFDFTLLLGNPPIRTIVAVGRDRTWYFLSKLRGQPTADPEVVFDAWGSEFLIRYNQYDAAIRSGIMLEHDALGLLTHEISIALAARWGLRYDRLEMG